MKLNKLLILHRKVNSNAAHGAAVLAVALAAGLTLFAGQAAGKTYRWVDDDGTVVYSQTPPRDDRPAADIKPPPPPPVSPEAAREQLEQRMQLLDDRREDKELANTKRGKGRRERSEKRQACEAARGNLAKLQRSMNKQIKMPDGSFQRLDENERQTKIRESEASIEKNCN